MEDGDTEKYHPSRVIQDCVFSSRKGGCIRCISLQVCNEMSYVQAHGENTNDTFTSDTPRVSTLISDDVM